MTLHFSGLMAVPAEPAVQVAPVGIGVFINFRLVTQGKSTDNQFHFQYWDCSVFLRENDQAIKWQEDYLTPGNVLYIEYGEITSTLSPDGRFTRVKLKLDNFKTKKLDTPLWQKE